ncbi:hypothetical protein BSKO_05955 [Bryopsis sp. KO-2023]|nr:hypothetical protein BSKO_05955 [Bryopsis sp. KO-2023]
MTVEIWRDLSQEQQDRYFELADNQEEAASHLAEALNLPKFRDDARSAIKLDYATYALSFAKEMGFPPKKTSALFSIAQDLLSQCEQLAPLEKVGKKLRSGLLSLCSARAASQDSTLAVDEIAKIAKFFATTFMQHYRLYLHAFSETQAHTEYEVELRMETPVIQSFDNAMSEEEWERHVQEESQAKEAARKAAEEDIIAKQEAERVEKETREKEEAERIRQEELKKKPQTLDEAVAHAVAVRMEDEKEALAEEYRKKEEVLLERIKGLEEKK